MHSLINDIRYATRGLFKNPGFAIVAILTLGLGIGVNSALFTVFNAFVLKPLPVTDPASLVNFEGSNAEGHRRRLFSYLDYQDYKNQTVALSDVVAWNKVSTTLGDAPPDTTDDSVLPEGYENLFGQIASDNYFNMLGAEFELGRGFAPNEGDAVVVLSHGFWQRRFQSDPSIVGKSISLRGVPFKVIGVTAKSFVGTSPDVPAFWAPLALRDSLITNWGHQVWRTERDSVAFVLVGRLAPGVSRNHAQADLQLTTNRLVQAFPSEERQTKITLTSGATFVTLDEDTLPLLTPLTIGFGLILLMACANVANLLLARAAGRQREIGVRLALGAGRWRIIRQLVTESVLLAIIGGALGLIISIWTLSALYPIVLSAFPLPSEIASGFTLNIGPDWRIFGFTLLLASIAGTVAGLAPALQASKSSVIESIKEEGSALGGRFSQSRLRSLLVVAQIATCFALLIGAALLVQNSRKLQNADIGMSTDNVFGVVFSVGSNVNQKPSSEVVSHLHQEVVNRIRMLPGVTSVSYAYNRPLSGQIRNTMVSFGDSDPPQSVETPFNLVSADYFQTVSLPIIRGRAFTEDEVRSKAQVVVISEGTASRYWPGREPLGQRIRLGTSMDGNPKDRAPGDITSGAYEVVGVARETRNRWIWQKDEKFLYLPLTSTAPTQYLLVKTKTEPGPIMAQARELISTVHPSLRSSIKSFDDDLAFQTAPFRAIAWISGVLGLLALLLCAVGLYGVLSYMVASRTREIGIRVALGARPTTVVRMFTFQGLKLTAIGIAIGLAGGAIIAQLLSTVLIDLSALDPLAYGSVALFLMFIAFMAIVIPSWRATKVDPMEALRYE